MHGLTVRLDDGEHDIEVSDLIVCRASGLCHHETNGIAHATGDRITRIVLGTKVEKWRRFIIHEVFMGASLKPGEVRQTPGKLEFFCCSKVQTFKPKERGQRKIRGDTVQRSALDPCSHILGVANAMGLIKVRHRPEMLRHAKPTAIRLQAPDEVLDPRTLEQDVGRQALPFQKYDYSSSPPNNRAKLEIHPDGRIVYDGPEGETSRLLARHGRRLAAGASRIVTPEEAFDPRLVAMMVLTAGEEGLTEHDLYQARADELGDEVLLDEPLSLAFLERLRPAVDEWLHKVAGKALVVDKQRLREGGVVVVLACR